MLTDKQSLVRWQLIVYFYCGDVQIYETMKYKLYIQRNSSPIAVIS